MGNSVSDALLRCVGALVLVVCGRLVCDLFTSCAMTMNSLSSAKQVWDDRQLWLPVEGRTLIVAPQDHSGKECDIRRVLAVTWHWQKRHANREAGSLAAGRAGARQPPGLPCNTDLRTSARITSHGKPWRAHSCVRRRDSSRRFFAPEHRASARHARVRTPHGPAAKCEVIFAWSLSPFVSEKIKSCRRKRLQHYCKGFQRREQAVCRRLFLFGF
jgi:hypothetical protein